MSKNMQFETVTSQRERASSFVVNEAYIQGLKIQELEESLAILQSELEGNGWELLGGTNKWDFSHLAVLKLRRDSRLMAIKNPLVKRAIRVKAFYVWGLDCTISAKRPEVNKVIQSFLKDRKNRVEIGTKVAREQLERDQSTLGTRYFMFFVDRADTGRVQMRTVGVDQITDIFTNPDDYRERWLYKREIPDANMTGKVQVVWYPDINYRPVIKEIPETLQRLSGSTQPIEIDWDHPIYMVKTGHTDDMKFGLPEYYAGFSWAYAYKIFLENWCTIMRAYARMAGQLTAKNKTSVAAAKSKLDPNSAENAASGNTLTGVAGFMAVTGGAELKSIKTSGSTTSGSEGYPILAMFASASDMPSSFFGDADLGNYATAETLDRPTELMMRDRQNFWASVFNDIFEFTIEQAVIAPNGPLRELADYTIEEDLQGQLETVIVWHDETNAAYGVVGEPICPNVKIDFPDILERSIADQVRAVIGAVTLNGNQPTDILVSRRVVAEALLKLIRPNDWEEVLNMIHPPGEKEEPIMPPITGGNGQGQGNPNDPSQTGDKKPTTPKEKAAGGSY